MVSISLHPVVQYALHSAAWRVTALHCTVAYNCTTPILHGHIAGTTRFVDFGRNRSILKTLDVARTDGQCLRVTL